MNKKGWILAVSLLLVAKSPLVTSWVPLSLKSPIPSAVFSGHEAFVHQTGQRDPAGWGAYYRTHVPGYLVAGLKSGGESLPAGTYRYDFYFARRPGHLPSLISQANDVVRIEVIDTVTKEVLRERTLQLVDFPNISKRAIRKGLVFSTHGMEHHPVSPRIYWQGMAAIALVKVTRSSMEESTAVALSNKTKLFESMMKDQFLDRGYVVLRMPDGRIGDEADAAIWTGIYAASQAMRYKMTLQPQALKRLEDSLWALHRLREASPLPGTLVRYVSPEGKPFEQSASKDTYTGFFYGVARGLPFVKDSALRAALYQDIQILADHFLDQGLAFQSPYGRPVDLSPYPSKYFVAEAVQEIRQNAVLRRDIAKALKYLRWYFWMHGQKPTKGFLRFTQVLKNPDAYNVEEELLPFLNSMWSALKKIQYNIHAGALRGPRQGLTDTPYIKLDLLLLRALHQLQDATDGKSIRSFEEFKVLPSQSIHSLHFIKVAAEAFPKPNRYDTFYRANLYEGKALLRTAMQWEMIDEDVMTAILGETEASTARSSSSHLGYLALHNLILLEADPLVRFKYQKLFEAKYAPMKIDGNAMLDAMQAAVGLSTQQLGLAWWSLGRYPVDRRGKGEAFWRANKEELVAVFGGVVNRKARDPLPPDLRPRDAFIWQRSARSIYGDAQDWLYPPLDYLFAYWLARSAASLDAAPENS